MPIRERGGGGRVVWAAEGGGRGGEGNDALLESLIPVVVFTVWVAVRCLITFIFAVSRTWC